VAAEDEVEPNAQAPLTVTNCHVHIFTYAHTPDRFLPWPVADLVRLRPVRRLLSWAARVFDPNRK
jgi:hypothetical protein